MSNSRQKTKVFYIDDEEDIREIVVAALEHFGNYDVTTCSSGEEALKICQRFRPDVLLLDVMMPRMDGPATLTELRKISHFATIPTIFITAKVQPDEIKQYTSIGPVGIIKKPFEVTELASLIEDYIHSHHNKP